MSLPTNVITASVGVGGTNRKADVILIQTLLNGVPLLKGGPTPLLKVDGACGPKTCNAISRFQKVQFGSSDGRIDPGYQTIQSLVQLLTALGILAQLIAAAISNGGTAPSGPLPPGVPPSPGGGGSATGLRAEIKKWALLATKGPYGAVGANAPHGIVSDLDTVLETLSWGGSRTIRRGWKNYKAFFDEVVAGWTENHWKAPGYLDGVKVPGKRVPQGPSKPSGISWCGIFGTWCWAKAGKQTKWVAGVGPTNATRISGNSGIQIGDICVQSGQEVHHFVAVDIQGDTIQGVNGNSDYQSILLKPMSRGTVIYYYRPE
jgi:hypothetical protein